MQTRNNGVDNANQLTLVADYRLSKRTDIYAAGAYVRDKGFNARTTAGVGLSSDTGNQSTFRVGVRHTF